MLKCASSFLFGRVVSYGSRDRKRHRKRCDVGLHSVRLCLKGTQFAHWLVLRHITVHIPSSGNDLQGPNFHIEGLMEHGAENMELMWV